MMTPFRSLYQGVRNKTDKKVFRRRFEYEAQDKGHQILCEGIFDCYVSIDYEHKHQEKKEVLA